MKTFEMTITGASDDLIEIGGNWQEELNHYPKDDQTVFLAISDGTLFDVTYDKDGLWRFKRQFSGISHYAKEEGSTESDTNDVVTLTSCEPFRWAVLGDRRAVK